MKLGTAASRAAYGRLRRWAGIAVPALVAGVVMALSLPPFGWWPLAFVGAAVLWSRLGGLGLGSRLGAGWMFGIGMFTVGLWWVTSFNVYGGVLLMLVEAIAPAVAAAASPPGRGRVPALAGAMVLMEAARSHWPLGGLPLGGTALGQAGGPLLDAARLGGPLLLVGLVWLGGGGLGRLAETVWRLLRARVASEPAGWRALTGNAPPPGVVRVDPVPVLRPAVAGVVGVAVVAAVAWAGVASGDGGRARTTILVAAVQGGGVRGLSKEQVDPATVFAAQVAATETLIGREAAGTARARLVVWPEDVVGLNEPYAGSAASATVSSLAQQADAALVAGVTEPAGATHFRNEIVSVAPDGQVTDVFEKVHRVPFGEYIPWRSFIRHVADVSAVPQDAVPGHGSGLLRTTAAPLGAMVSYEVFFADRGRSATRAGAELLIVPTNTSSYSTSQVPTQEVAASRLQAVSEGRDLVQAAPTGFSALVDHDGRILVRSSLGPAAVLSGRLSLRTGRTVYEVCGDLPVLVAAGAALVGGALLVPSLPTRRRRRPSTTRGPLP